MDSLPSFDAAIVGGGLAGTTVASQLALLAPSGFRALLIEAGDPGPGTAYAAVSDRLFMNGTALSMSAVPGDAQHLVRWLRTEPDRALIPRRLFGTYLSERFREAIAQRPEFEIARGEAIDIADDGERFTLVDARGLRYAARDVILALGNFPPDDGFLPDAMRAHRGFVSDPWRFSPARGKGDVLVIGSGLTAMDAIALLDERQFRGTVHIVSRHGLIPCVEDPFARALDPKTLALRTETPLELLRSLRSAAAAHAQRGGDWRDAVESIRSMSPAIWSGWSLRERRRFLRHLQAFWAVHRYRVPPQTAAVFERLERDGRIRRHRGRVAGARAGAGGLLDVDIETSSGDVRIQVERSINCTGPNGDYDRIGHPLVRSLNARGSIRPDPLHLGIEVTPDLRVVDRRGRPNDRLFSLGPPVRGMWYESTAVPETREQAACIARGIAAAFKAAGLEAAS